MDRLHSHGSVAGGGYGSVFVAEDRTTGQLVAVKRQPTPSDTVAREFRFFRSLGQYEHPNVMKLLDQFVWPGGSDMCFVFEHMEGTLWEWWRRRRGVGPLQQVQKLARQATAGLGHLHQLDIVHADLSMANMLLTEDLHLRISDLGGAVTSVDGRVSAPSHVGTTEYVRAPEVILRSPQATHAIDAWALGVVCMGLLCGSLVVWRASEHDVPHPELLMADDPVDGAEPRDCPGLRTIANTARLLGPLPESLWPEMAGEELGAMHESPYGQAVSRASLRLTTAAFLADSNLVKRCVDVDSLGLDFVVGLLQWGPQSRRRITSCVSHAWFCEEQVSLPPAEEALLSQVSATALQGLVRSALHTGLPIRLGDLAAAAAGAEPRAAASPVGGVPQPEQSLLDGAPLLPAGSQVSVTEDILESPGACPWLLVPPGSEVSLTEPVPGGPGATEWWLQPDRPDRARWQEGVLQTDDGASPSASLTLGGSTSQRPPRKRFRAKSGQATGEGGSAASGTEVAPATSRAGRTAPTGLRKQRGQRAQAPSHGAPLRKRASSSQLSASQSVANPPFKRPCRNVRPVSQAEMWQLAFEAVSEADELEEAERDEALGALSDEAGVETGGPAEGADPGSPLSLPPGQPSPSPAASSPPLAPCLSQSLATRDPYLGPSQYELEPFISAGDPPVDPFGTGSALQPVADVAPTSAGSTVNEAVSHEAADSGAVPQAPSHESTPAASVPGDPLHGKCRCRGNCGQASCKAAKNRFSRKRNSSREVVFCHVPLCSWSESFCRLCACEACGFRGRQGRRGCGRFCGACATMLGPGAHASLAGAVDAYVNRYGTFNCEEGWTWELQMTARFSYLTEACLGLEDVYWLHFVKDFLDWRAVASLESITHPRDWSFLATVASVRTPRVVAQAISRLEGAEPREMTLEDWRAYLLRLLDCADGNDWHDMWEYIAPHGTSQLNQWPGLCHWARSLKLLRKLEQGHEADEAPKSRKTRAPRTEGRVLRLGRGLLCYELLPPAQSHEALEGLLRLRPPVWPSCEQVAARNEAPLHCFAEVVSEAVAACMPGDAGSGIQYSTRRLLSLLEMQHGPQVWDPLTMAELQQMASDANKHTGRLAHWGCEQVRRHFGMSPLQISSAASSWESVNKADGDYLSQLSPTQIFNSIRTLHRTEAAPSHDGPPAQLSWWPSMRQLSRALVEQSTMSGPGDAADVKELPDEE